MAGPVHAIRIERLELESGIKAYRLEVDGKVVQDHFRDALADVVGHNITWSSRNHAIVDGLSLLESGSRSGQFAILNCTCGSGAECADLESEIEVEHAGEFVIWKYHAPRYQSERSAKVFTFKFDRSQYLKELGKIEKRDDLKDLPGRGALERIVAANARYRL